MTGGTFDFSPSGGAFSSDSLGWLLGLVLPLGDGWAVGASAGVCGYDAGYLGVDFEGGAFFADAALLYDAGRLHQVLSLGVGSFGVDTRRDVAVRAHGYDMEGVLRVLLRLLRRLRAGLLLLRWGGSARCCGGGGGDVKSPGRCSAGA